jgi:hypothetical protein
MFYKTGYVKPFAGKSQRAELCSTWLQRQQISAPLPNGVSDDDVDFLFWSALAQLTNQPIEKPPAVRPQNTVHAHKAVGLC